MTELNTQSSKPYDPIETLARSLFGFAFLAWIPMLITWVLLLLSPISPSDTFAQIRTLIIIGFGIFTVLGFGLLVWLFRHQPAELIGISSKIHRTLGNRWMADILLLVLLELNFVAFLTLGNVAPTITNPAKFLLVCWSLILFGVILTLRWLEIQDFFRRTQGIWLSIGLMICLIVLGASLFILTSRMIDSTGIVGRLSGSLDYRQLEFIDDGNAPTPSQYWAEQGQMTVRWLPYNYWTVAPYKGKYINIDNQGIRYTPAYIKDSDSVKKIYFFGGSTMWGEGARDAYTIPGHTAKMLNDAGQAQTVLNYGQTGYVSTQDLILFQSQIALDNVPDIALFYQGFNDIYSAYLQDMAGIPLRESNRISDVEAGRILRAGQPVFRLPDADLAHYDWSLIATESANAESIANRWLANVKIVQSIADAYKIKVIFIWQPALFAKDELVGDEVRILHDLENNSPGFTDLYQEVDKILRQKVTADGIDNIIFLTDLFKDDERAIFHDLVHITEIGNQSVAEAILPILLDVLAD